MAVSGGGAGQLNERELVITRIFDAPRRLVYEAWTDPEHMKRWWGPKGSRARYASWMCVPAEVGGS